MAGHLGDEATARSLLDDPVPAVRSTALGALARAGGLSRDDLVAAVTDPAPDVRRRAVEVVAALGEDPAGIATGVSLLPLLDDDDAAVVEVAAWACGERTPAEPGAVGRLAALATGHDDALVRESAVAALGAIGDPAGLPAILAATDGQGHRPPPGRDRPRARSRGPRSTPRSSGRSTDRDWQVRQSAEDLTAPPPGTADD